MEMRNVSKRQQPDQRADDNPKTWEDFRYYYSGRIKRSEHETSVEWLCYSW